MKRRTAGLMLCMAAAGITAAFSLSGTGAQAMTYARGDGSVCPVENRKYGVSEPEQARTESGAAAKDLENWQKARLREEISLLKEYGVTFDEEQECLLYQGRKIRLLIDEQIEDTYSSIQMPDGEIDLYTVRSKDYTLTGVRTASQEEYDRHTENLREREYEKEASHMLSAEFGETDEDAAYAWENPWGLETGVVLEDTVTIAENESRAVEDTGIRAEDDTAAAASDVSEDIVISIAQETTASGSVYDTPSEEEKKRITEYADVGIERNSHGGWMYQGKEIDWLVDEDGGIYMTNENKDRKDRLYVVVRRNEDGSVREAEEVMMEDAIRSYVESGT